VTVAVGSSPAIGEALANPCQGADLLPDQSNLELVRAAILCLINQTRARGGKLPLRPNAALEQAAQGYSDRMVAEDYFEHVAPNGETPANRLKAAGYLADPRAGYTIGENIAWGTGSLSTPRAIVAAWIASPEHLSNILDDRYRDTAIGVAAAAPSSLGGGQAGATYTQEFGVID
jgi:uncharacterized protein YkwD